MDSTGKRLRLLRSISGKSRAEIARKYHIPEISLRQWENDKYKLSNKSAQKCFEIYTAEGVHISLEWIKTGIGLDPFFATSLNKTFSESLHDRKDDFSENLAISDELIQIEEAQLFIERNKNSAVLLVSNDDMLPNYAPGDYVGGIFFEQDELHKAVGYNCIISLENSINIFRRVVQSPVDKLYNLACLNPFTRQSEPVMFKQSILKAAPIIWHRKPRLR